jgi:hypothetical protein
MLRRPAYMLSMAKELLEDTVVVKGYCEDLWVCGAHNTDTWFAWEVHDIRQGLG